MTRFDAAGGNKQPPGSLEFLKFHTQWEAAMGFFTKDIKIAE